MEERKTMNEVLEVNPQEINYQITSVEDLTRINIVLRKIIESEKKISDKLDPEIANAYKTHKGLTALKKTTLEPFVNAREKINQSIKNWHIEQERVAKELQDKINSELKEQAEWKDVEPIQVDIKDCIQKVAPKQEGQYKRSNWKARIIDEKLIPRDFLMPNISKLDKFAKANTGLLTVDGVEFYDDFTIVTKV